MIEPVIPLRALEHFAYCPRQAAIIHVDGIWFDNEHTIRGVRGHRRVDSAPSRTERGRRVIGGMDLWSESLGLTGRADAVEISPTDDIEPVEYKHGARHGRNAEIQLCAQALCLEEMLSVQVRTGHVWYAATRRRDRVPIDGELRALTLDVIVTMRATFTADRLPPAVNDRRCQECQLLGHCVPDVVADPGRVTAYIEREVLACG